MPNKCSALSVGTFENDIEFVMRLELISNVKSKNIEGGTFGNGRVTNVPPLSGST